MYWGRFGDTLHFVLDIVLDDVLDVVLDDVFDVLLDAVLEDIIVQLGSKLNTKIALDHPPTHHPPTTTHHQELFGRF